MAPLDGKARAGLPDSAFAYIDSAGRRRLPINDAAHVRNALARFEQTEFEDEGARERARLRLLKAAKKYAITPLGFFDGQLRKERRQGELKAQTANVTSLPTGMVTFLLADMERSTQLLQRLGDGYAELLRDVRSVIRATVRRLGGEEVDARADEFFAVFIRPSQALNAAISIQRFMNKRAWPQKCDVRLRIGLHTGRPALAESGYVGIAVNTAARVCSASHGGQILLSAAAQTALSAGRANGIAFRALGRYRLAGLAEPVGLFQVEVAGLLTEFPRPRARAAR